MGTKIHHIQLKVISVWLHTVIPPKLSKNFFSRKAFAKQGKDKTATAMILCETLKKDIFCLRKWFCGMSANYRANQNNKELGEWTDRWGHIQAHYFYHVRAISYIITILQTASIFFYSHNQCEQFQRRICGPAWVSVCVALLLHQ